MNKKGVILVVVMIFLLIGMITGVGLYNEVYNIYRMQSINQAIYARGYYAALGALRFVLSSVTPRTAGMTTTTISSTSNNQLWTDLGLAGLEKITVDYADAGHGNGDVLVTATYTSN